MPIIGTTLQCYFCVGSLESDCANGDTTSMVIQHCENRTMADMPTELQEHYGNDKAVFEQCTAFSARGRSKSIVLHSFVM